MSKASFKKIPDDELDSCETLPDAVQVNPVIIDPDGASYASFKRIFEPRRVKELFEYENFAELLGKSLIFIHNRKTSSKLLIDEEFKHVWDLFDYSIIDTNSQNIDIVLRQLKVKTMPNPLGALFSTNKTNSNKKPKVIIIDAHGANQINGLCDHINKIEHREFGVWVRGHLWDLDPYILSRFDALFLFDMASREYDILKSAIDVSNDVIHDLSSSSDQPNSNGKVLFFLNTERLVDAPLLWQNPVILDR